MAIEAAETTAASVDTSTGTAAENQQIQTQEAKPVKTYTEDEYQKMSSGQYAAGLAAAMKEAGFEPSKGEDFKKQMKAFSAWQDSQKSELEKVQGSLSTIEQERNTALAEKQAIEAQFLAVSKGVPSDRAKGYVALSQLYIDDKTNLAAALDKALIDYPITSEKTRIPGAGGNPPSAPKDPNAWQDKTKAGDRKLNPMFKKY